jgi:hypothetical protein
MTITTAIVTVAFIGAVVYLLRLALIERGDLEATAKIGVGEFSLKAKARTTVRMT